MNITDPIIIPEHCWTKERIWDQLDRDGSEFNAFTADAISDEDAIWWVREEEDLRSAMMHEEEYVEAVIELNVELIQRTNKNNC